MDEIESKGRKRQRGQVTSDRGSRSRSRRETLDRHAGADARESKDTASAIDKMVVDLQKRSNRSPRERDGSKRRNRRVDVAGR